MITFIIPVKSKRVSGSWEHFSKLFERTIKSVTNQTSGNFRVVVVCHEKPEISFEHPKVEYIHVDFEPPVLKPELAEKHDGMKEEDKSNKILAGLDYIKKYEQDYIMVADADDCISNRIAEYVDDNKSQNLPGWYFKKGYIYREGDKFISLNKKGFNLLCGTCIVIKPELIQYIFQRKPHLLYVHQTIELTENQALSPLPLAGAIYSMGNGENHFMSGRMMKDLATGRKLFSLNTIRGIVRKLKKYRVKPLSSKIKNEFGIYTVNEAS